MFTIREYQDRDADNWLRCRLLSFFYTNYYDDVVTSRPSYDQPAITLVAVDGAAVDGAAVDGETVVGLMDVRIGAPRATVEVLAVHPDHARKGIGRALLTSVETTLRAHSVASLDAWTREDIAANRWYVRTGFREAFSYVHVHKVAADDDSDFETPLGLGKPLTAFMHAPREREATLRRRFRRVYVCRQYVKTLAVS